MSCMLPDGTSVPSCIPVAMSPQAMFGTSTSIHATTNLGVALDNPTGPVLMRLREPASGPITGYIYDAGGTPHLQVVRRQRDAHVGRVHVERERDLQVRRAAGVVDVAGDRTRCGLAQPHQHGAGGIVEGDAEIRGSVNRRARA